MIRCSVLTKEVDGNVTQEAPEAPDFFGDLNLDQIVDGITAGKQEYNLKPFFNAPLRDVDAIMYRQEVMRDLEDRRLADKVDAFAKNMRVMRQHLTQAEKLYHKHQKERWFLDAVEIYCEAVQGLARELADPGSEIARDHGFPRVCGRVCDLRRLFLPPWADKKTAGRSVLSAILHPRERTPCQGEKV